MAEQELLQVREGRLVQREEGYLSEVSLYGSEAHRGSCCH